MTSTERVKKICQERKIPISRLEKECCFANGYIGQLKKDLPLDRAQKISDYLNVSLEFLLTGKETSEGKESSLNAKDYKNINSILNNTRQLLEQDGLMFDGNPATQEAIDSILSAMQIGMAMAKKKNKEKYTPDKYKKE